jgi:hypothetical protein
MAVRDEDVVCPRGDLIGQDEGVFPVVGGVGEP